MPGITEMKPEEVVRFFDGVRIGNRLTITIDDGMGRKWLRVVNVNGVVWTVDCPKRVEMVASDEGLTILRDAFPEQMIIGRQRVVGVTLG